MTEDFLLADLAISSNNIFLKQTFKDSDKYPTSRTEYANVVGKIREKEVKKVLEKMFPNELGFEVICHHINGNGCDVSIKDHNQEGKIIVGFEVMNENIGSYIDIKRAKRIRKNLKGIGVKGLIISHKHCIKSKEIRRILKNIPKITINFQILPKSYFDYYFKQDKVFLRKIANNYTFNLLRNHILTFFYQKSLSMLMYINELRLKYINEFKLKDKKVDNEINVIEANVKDFKLRDKLYRKYKKYKRQYRRFTSSYLKEKLKEIRIERMKLVRKLQKKYVIPLLSESPNNALKDYKDEREKNRERLLELRAKTTALVNVLLSKKNQAYWVWRKGMER